MARPKKKTTTRKKKTPSKLEGYKEIYFTKKEQLEDIAGETKKKVKKHPYEALGIAAGVGALIGIGIGAAMGAQCQKKQTPQHKAQQQWRKYTQEFENDIKDKPFESIGIALGVGAAVATLASFLKK